MSFLQSVIADARPHKSMPEFSDSPSPMTRWKTRGLDGDTSTTEEKSPNAADQTSRPGMSLHIRDRADEFIGSDTSTLSQADNPVNQNIQSMDSNVTSESPFSILVDEPGPVFDEESHLQLETGNLPGRESGPGANRSSKPEESVTPPLTTAAAAVSYGGEADGGLQDSGESRMDDGPRLAIGQSQTPDKSTGRNDVDKTLADGGKAHQVSADVDNQVDMKSLSNQEEIPRLQKPYETRGDLHDVRLVSRQAMAMDSHISSGLGPASAPRPAGNKESTSLGSPGSKSSKPGGPVQQIAKPARPSASPDALRSVPARPFHTDLRPKDGDSAHSRVPLRSPEKKHEAPKVQIGQIDVIIEAATQPGAKPATPSSPIDLASRYYLRRL